MYKYLRLWLHDWYFFLFKSLLSQNLRHCQKGLTFCNHISIQVVFQIVHTLSELIEGLP